MDVVKDVVDILNLGKSPSSLLTKLCTQLPSKFNGAGQEDMENITS